MPTKLGKGGAGQQNYVPKGNGDASGEYGDNANGSNKHFTVEKKPREYKVYQRRKGAYQFQISKFKYEELKKSGADVFEENANLNLTPEKEKEIENAFNNLKIEPQLSFLNAMSSFKNLLMFKLNINFSDRDIIADAYYSEMEEKYDKLRTELVEKNKKILNETFNKIEGEHTLEQDLVAVNKTNYDKSKYGSKAEYFKWHNNCQRCVQAYLLRRLGYDVEANERLVDDNLPGWSYATIFEPKNGFKRYFGSDLGRNTVTQYVNINDIVSKDKDGSIYFCKIGWKGGDGHIFIVENQNGEAKFIDPQSGKSADDVFKKDYTGKYLISPQFTQLTKVDNVDINSEYLKEVAKNK